MAHPTHGSSVLGEIPVVVADSACGPGWYRTARGTCRRTVQEPVPVPRWRPPGDRRKFGRTEGQPPVLRRAAPGELDAAPPPHLRWSPPPAPPRWQDTRPRTPGGLSNPTRRY
ncbi:MAG: GCG_CRPN prefix-to-repeats domain-containing protein [Pseudorhizobium sp.]